MFLAVLLAKFYPRSSVEVVAPPTPVSQPAAPGTTAPGATVPGNLPTGASRGGMPADGVPAGRGTVDINSGR